MLAVILILCIGTGFVIIIVFLVRRKQTLPSGQHDAVLIAIVHVILDPSGLHGAGIVKMIPVIVDLFPFFLDGFSVLIKIVPVIAAAIVVTALYLKPLACIHDTVRTYKIIIIVHPGVDSHNAAAV